MSFTHSVFALGHPTPTVLALGLPQGAEWLVIAALGLLIFGKRLPEVGKGIGEAIRNFKKGMNSAEDEVEQVDAAPVAPRLTAKTDYKFDPETGKPIEQPKVKFDPYTGKPIEHETTA